MTVRPILSPRAVGQLQRLALRGHNLSIVVRRGETTLPAQRVAMKQNSMAREPRTESAQSNHGRVLIFGAAAMNIAVGDRVTFENTLYEISFIRPDRTVETVAEAEAIAILQATPAPTLAGWLPGMATGLIAPPTYATEYEVA